MIYCTLCTAEELGAYLDTYVVRLKQHENLQPLVASSRSETQSSMRDLRLPTRS
jgi:hypothetical protein